MATLAKLAVVLDLIDKLSAPIRNSGKTVGEWGNSIQSTGQKLNTHLTLPIVGLGIAATKMAGDFEQAMANVAAVTDLTDAEFKQLSDLAKQLGLDTRFSATQAANAIGELAKAGIPVQDILAGAARAATDLAAATGIDLAQAATVMANAMNVFKIAGSDAQRVADGFANAANKSSADVSSLAQGMAQAGNVAHQFGISFESTLATLALFADYGLQGSDAGTSLRTMLLSLLNPTKEAQTLMDSLGLSFFNANGQFIGIAGVADQLRAKLANLTPEQRNAALAILFGSDAVRAASVLYEAGGDAVRSYEQAVSQQGTAQKMAAERTDTLYGSLENLRSALESSAIIIGADMAPAIEGMAASIERATVAFDGLPAPIQKTFVVLATILAVVGPLAIAIGFVATHSLAFGAALGTVIAPLTVVVGWLINIMNLPLVAAIVAWKTNFLGFRDAIVGGIDALGQFERRAIDWAMELPGKIAGAITGMVQAGKDLLTGFNDGIQAVWSDTIVPAIQGIGPWIIDQFANAATWLLLAGMNLLIGLNNGIQGVWTGTIVPAIQGIGPWIISQFTNALGWLVAAGINVLAGLKSGMQSAFDGSLQPFVSGIPGWIKSQFFGAAGWLYDVGASIVQGLADGLRAGAGLVMDAVNYLIGLIPGPIKSALGIHSPSRVMRDLLYAVPQGMALGLADGAPLIASAVSRLASATIGDWSSPAMGIGMTGATMAAGAAGGVYNINVTVNALPGMDERALADYTGAAIARELSLRSA